MKMTLPSLKQVYYATNINVIEVLELSREMLKLADQGDKEREDRSCGVMYGILRDNGYKLERLARQEIESHRIAGTWDSDLDEYCKGIVK